MKITGAIFDFDGTLADSMEIWDNLGTIYLKKKGIEPSPEVTEKIKTMSIMESAVYMCDYYGTEFKPQQIIDEVFDELLDYYSNTVLLKPDTREFLQILKQNGVKIAVATASPHSLVEPAMKRNGIFDYIDTIVTNDDVGCGKVKPDIYYKALENIGTDKASSPVFEDALYAITTAKNAGFPTVGVYDETERNQTGLKGFSDIFVEYAYKSLEYLEF